MLHLIPDDDGLAHAPTTECGCDPRPGRWRGRDALFHNSPIDDGDWGYYDTVLAPSRLREVTGHDLP